MCSLALSTLTSVLLSWSFWKPQARTSYRRCLLHTFAVQLNTLGENCIIPVQMATHLCGPDSGAARQPFWFSSVTVKKIIKKKKKGQHPSCLRTSFSADLPIQAKVIRHLSAEASGCYCFDIKITKLLHCKSEHSQAQKWPNSPLSC